MYILTYSPLLGGCYVYNGTINHYKVLYQVSGVPISGVYIWTMSELRQTGYKSPLTCSRDVAVYRPSGFGPINQQHHSYR